jgi:hypothetical protein
MSARRLEEIFEECVTAYLEGRRSIQESLQLYPAYAFELAPLLRTAVQLNESFSKVEPPAHVQERVRHRFLSDARARRQVRSLTHGHRRAGFIAGLWQGHRFGFAAAAGAVAVLVVAVGSVAMLSNGGRAGGPDTVENITAAPATQRATPPTVTNIRASTSNIRDRGQAVQPSDIAELVSATFNLTAVSPDEVQGSRAEVEQALRDADSALTEVIGQQPELAGQIQDAKDTLRDVASGFGFDLNASPAATSAATPTPVETGETPEPTPQVTEEPTEGPTVEPTVAPAETPVPTTTPERGLPADG